MCHYIQKQCFKQNENIQELNFVCSKKNLQAYFFDELLL